LKKKNNKIAVYPGTFDPLTFGHLDIIKRASVIFDNIIIAVAESSSKKTLFTADERVKMIMKVTPDIKNIKVESFKGLLVNYAERINAGIIIRGLRTVSDFDFEFRMALTNKKLSPAANTVFLMPSEKYFYISSTLVKEIAKNGENVSAFVPPKIAAELAKKYKFR
jgi:pantetheine-phosphate adenylyltransferase